MWILYELLLVIAFVLYLPKALWRRRLPHPGWAMRLGRYPEAVRERLRGGGAIWVHAVSVGEVQAARPLLTMLRQRYPRAPLVISTVTATGFGVAQQAVGEEGTVIYAPLDLRGCVQRALQTIQPRVLLLMESELWPVMIALTQARGVPIAVVNGRISYRAFRRYRLVTPLLKEMLDRVALFLMQSQADADRLLGLGAAPEKVRVLGNMKWDASLGARPSPEQVTQLAVRLGLHGDAKILVAGSTHRGEEDTVLDAYRTLRAEHPSLRLVIAPRHLERVGEVEALLQRSGLQVIRLSTGEASAPWDIGLVDTMGQLPLYYGLASVVFIGGSLIPHGGQNPLEAASLGKPVVFGPYMHNFAEVTTQLVSTQAARQLRVADELTAALRELLADADQARTMGEKAKAITERTTGAASRTLEALQPLLS